MGYDPEIAELSTFLVDICEIEVKFEVISTKSAVGKSEIIWNKQKEPSTQLEFFPCRFVPVQIRRNEEDLKFEVDKKVVKATHRIFLRKQVTLGEFSHRIRNVNSDGKIYNILFIEEFPNDIGTQLKEVILSETKN